MVDIDPCVANLGELEKKDKEIQKTDAIVRQS
jgi:hypothetical protein